MPVQTSPALCARQKRSWLQILPIQVTASWAVICPASVPSLAGSSFGCGRVGGNPACSYHNPLRWAWPRTSGCLQGNSSAGLGPPPEGAYNWLELWQVPSWSWSHAIKRKNSQGKDERWAGKGDEEQGLQGKGAAVN